MLDSLSLLVSYHCRISDAFKYLYKKKNDVYVTLLKKIFTLTFLSSLLMEYIFGCEPIIKALIILKVNIYFLYLIHTDLNNVTFYYARQSFCDKFVINQLMLKKFSIYNYMSNISC